MDLKHRFVRPRLNRKKILIRAIFKSYFFPNCILILRLISESRCGSGRDGHFQRANKRIVKRQLNDVINSK